MKLLEYIIITDKMEKGNYVKIQESSQFFGCGRSNPDHIIGMITDTDGFGLPIRVIWTNGTYNSYYREDLKRVYYNDR